MGELKTGSPQSVVKLLAEILQKETSQIIAIGNKGIEAGVIMRLVTTKDDKPILDGWSLGTYGGTRKEWELKKSLMTTVGMAIEKSLFKRETFDIGAGVLVTKPVRDFLIKGNVNIAAGFTVRF